MRTGIPVFILFLFIVTGCANIGRFGEIMNPEQVSKDELKKLPTETTPEYGFRVAVERNVPGETGEILENVDYQFTEFSECFSIKDGGEKARQ